MIPAGIAAQAAPAWQVQISEQHGLPSASLGGQPGFSADWAFWGAKWKWAGVQSALAGNGAGAYRLVGEVKDLGVAQVSLFESDRLVYGPMSLADA